jgi:Uncharacterised nucleotidyltransferase
MRDSALKAAVIAVLGPSPDFSGLSVVKRCKGQDQRSLLRWLDESGLALYLLHQLQQHQALDTVPAAFRQALERRLASNRERTLDMLGEFRRLVQAFDERGVRFCALKGFSLMPDFCPSPHLRHQTDFDFLVAPEWMENAKQTMKSCGYAQQEIRNHGEVTFGTPLQHVPSPDDDIYGRPRHREVDLLASLRQQEHGVSIDARTDCLNRAQEATMHQIRFPVLALDDRFTLQVFHAFKHLLGSWVRLSWLLEIGHFMDVHQNDEDLWRSVAARAGQSPTTRNAFGLILSLTQGLFPRPIPHGLQEWCVRPLPDRLAIWVNVLGPRWAVSGLDGGKLTLLVHREFLDDPRGWNSYVASRIFPFGRNSSIGRVSTTAPGTRIKAQASQWLHSMRRAMFHVRELAFLPLETIRWHHALRSAEKQRTFASSRSDDNGMQSGAASSRALAGVARSRN